MELRGSATAEVRKGGRMSKGPDLSAFPIPRKGGARPIAMDEAAETAAIEEQRAGEGRPTTQTPLAIAQAPASPTRVMEPQKSAASRVAQAEAARLPAAAPSGQTVATTVKLDENRYLRLADAGRPGPGRLKRRTIQEMVIEALDEWFERRGL